MNKTELIAKIAEGAGLSKVDAKKALDAAVEATVAALKAGEKVQVPGIITLAVEKRDARKGINPQTKAPIEIAASKYVAFSAAKALKDKVN